VLGTPLQMSGWRQESLSLDVRISWTETGAQDSSSAVRLAKREHYYGCQDIRDRNCCSGNLFSCQAGERRALLRMSGYPGQKLVLRTPLQLSGWRKESLSSDVRISWTKTGAQDTSSAVRLAKGEPYFGCQDILDRNLGSGLLFSCQAGERRAFLRMSGYPGQKLGLRTPLQLSGWRKKSLTSDFRISWTDTVAQDSSSAVRLAKGEPYFRCQDILDRNWCSGYLFSCQAGERRAFLWMSGYPGQKLVPRISLQLSGWRKESLSLDVRISWTETGAQDTSSAVRLVKGEPFFGCQDILDRNWGSGHLFSCQAAERRALLRMSGYPGQKLGLRTPLQLSGCRKESLNLDVRISWTETGAQDTSSAVRLQGRKDSFSLDVRISWTESGAQDTSSAVRLQGRKDSFSSDVRISWTESGLRTPLQLSAPGAKGQLSADVRISWTESGAQDTSTAVRLTKGEPFFDVRISRT
jgi:ribosomal protein S16